MKKKVLVLQLSRLGDLLQSTLLLNSLKKEGKEVYLLGDEKNQAIAKELDVIDEFIPFKIGRYLSFIKKNNFEECFAELHDFISKINNVIFFEIYNLNHSDLNLYITDLINCKNKKGFKTGNNDFINFIYEILKNRKDNRFNLVDIFNCFSFAKIKSEKLLINKSITDKNRNTIEKIFKKRESIIFHLGAGHPLREWGVDNFVKLAEKVLYNFNVVITLTGGKNEKRLGNEFLENINGIYKNNIINLIGKTDISLLKTVILKSRVLVSTDTGVMHIAAACNVNIIALFYASAFVYETGPYCKNAIIISPEKHCYPCTEFAHCNDVNCKTDISIEDVFECIKSFLDKSDLRNHALKKKNVKFYKPYFDEFGINYEDILKGREKNKIREKGFDLCMKKI